MELENEEIKTLLEKLRDYKKVSKLSGRSIQALRSLNYRHWKITMHFWTAERKKYLIENFADKKNKELAAELGCSMQKIANQAIHLGLRKSRKHILRIYDEVSKNISSGPYRHKGFPPGFKVKSGPDHPNWIADRSQVKGRRNKQNRFGDVVKRKQLLLQENKCKSCNKELTKPEYDHVVPVVIGGTSDQSNCQALCHVCHTTKTQWEQKISNNFRDLEVLETLYFIARNRV